jgi:hypothetical protein
MKYGISVRLQTGFPYGPPKDDPAWGKLGHHGGRHLGDNKGGTEQTPWGGQNVHSHPREFLGAMLESGPTGTVGLPRRRRLQPSRRGRAAGPRLLERRRGPLATGAAGALR